MEPGFRGWRVVAGAFVLAVFGWGLGFYGPPAFLRAVRAERSWSVALVSAAVTLHYLLGAVVVANLPGLYRRLCLPLVTRLGAVGLVGWTGRRCRGDCCGATGGFAAWRWGYSRRSGCWLICFR